MDAQEFRGLAFVVVGHADGFQEGFFFQIPRQVPQGINADLHRFTSETPEKDRQMLRLNGIFDTVHGVKHSFEDVAHFPDIAGPFIILE